MKHQASFSSKDKIKKRKVSPAAIFVWRVNENTFSGKQLYHSASCLLSKRGSPFKEEILSPLVHVHGH